MQFKLQDQDNQARRARDRVMIKLSLLRPFYGVTSYMYVLY